MGAATPDGAIDPRGPYLGGVAAGFDEEESGIDRGSAARREPRVWLVDGYNVLHAGLLGRDRTEWWTAARRNQLLELAADLDAGEAEIWLVFDGPRPESEVPGIDATPPPRVHRVFATSADDWLVARVKAAEDPSLIAVVTADRKVADRARHRGAAIVHPRAFLEQCRSGVTSP